MNKERKAILTLLSELCYLNCLCVKIFGDEEKQWRMKEMSE
jgi:hypothetical protein